MNEYTPGPWTTRIDDDRLYVKTDQEAGNEISSIICMLSPYRLSELSDPGRHKADAQLIAVAPEMFDMLQDHLDNSECSCNDWITYHPSSKCYHCRTKDILLKARGLL